MVTALSGFAYLPHLVLTVEEVAIMNINMESKHILTNNATPVLRRQLR